MHWVLSSISYRYSWARGLDEWMEEKKFRVEVNFSDRSPLAIVLETLDSILTTREKKIMGSQEFYEKKQTYF